MIPRRVRGCAYHVFGNEPVILLIEVRLLIVPFSAFPVTVIARAAAALVVVTVCFIASEVLRLFLGVILRRRPLGISA